MLNNSLHITNDQYLTSKEVVTKKWYAIYTFFRSEKKVVDYLNKKGIYAYIPLLTKIKRYQRKIKKYEVPIINNYVFVCIEKNEINKVLETDQVIKFIKIGTELIAIPQFEIDILKKIEGKNIDIEVTNISYDIGDEVEISHGNLVGLKGKLISKAGKKKFTVELDHLGISLRLDVDINSLSKLNYYNRVTA